MAPLDWNEILSIESSSLQNDEDAAEKMFDKLAQVCFSFLFRCYLFNKAYVMKHQAEFQKRISYFCFFMKLK